MCLLFFKFDPNPPPDGFRLILVSNRDEYLDRPTKPADWWPNNQNILSGVDLQQGKEGGTWLGITKSGRLATLLNILEPEVDPNAKGRGALISNFLKGNEECLPYLQEISKEGELYNAFNLLVFDLSRQNSQQAIGYYSNKTGLEPQLVTPGTHGFCNATISKPWKKCVVGQEKFGSVVNGATTGEKEKLMDALIEMMSDTTPYPDQSIHRQCAGTLSPKLQQERSAICVRSLDENYGSRTHTIILIDATDEVTYLEKTLEEPIPTDEKDLKWITNRYSFNLEMENPGL
ncbi:transport and Golgi organization 2 homolog isoform X2 [Ptychodera flava]|uniref:transport and Golgi organization 2 homolog isoform X2 n=1 Tax=Ptychodera flava TaxID=63121 RepID=UPI003969C693